jgi:hypothetical protein
MKQFLQQPATFEIVQLSGVQEATWVAVASRQVCAFQIQLRQPVIPKDSKAPVPIAFSMGKLLRVDYSPDQDGTWFLRELMSKLEVQDFPADVEPASEMSFMAAILGHKLHRYEDGGFTNRQIGHWMPMKLTTRQGGDEVYLNLNEVESLGEFSSKGFNYGKHSSKSLPKLSSQIARSHQT